MVLKTWLGFVRCAPNPGLQISLRLRCIKTPGRNATINTQIMVIALPQGSHTDMFSGLVPTNTSLLAPIRLISLFIVQEK